MEWEAFEDQETPAKTGRSVLAAAPPNLILTKAVKAVKQHFRPAFPSILWVPPSTSYFYHTMPAVANTPSGSRIPSSVHCIS